MAEQKNIFQKIIDREIPAEIVYEDEHALAFKDIAPQAPVHILVIPKKFIRNVAGISDIDGELLGHLFKVIRDLAVQFDVAEGYRVITNSGAPAGQSVDHLHFHLMGGRSLDWPPG